MFHDELFVELVVAAFQVVYEVLMGSRKARAERVLIDIFAV